jgi:manganese/zinc/iron transport system permease protein
MTFFPSESVWSVVSGLMAERVFIPPFLYALLISLVCAWLGVHLFLRGLAMAGDAVSHSVLPGMVAAYVVTGAIRGVAPFIGAAVSGWLAVALAGRLGRLPRMRPDAALGAVYGVAFGLGVLGVGLFARNVHLDAECVLNGDLLLVGGEQEWGEWLGPMGLAAAAVLIEGLVGARLRLSAFDRAFADVGGLRVRGWNGLVVGMLSVTAVTGFRAMGIVPVLAMTTIPVAAGWALGGGYRQRMLVALGVSGGAVIVGFAMAVWMEVPPPPAMGVCALVGLAVSLAARGIFRRKGR